MPRPTHHYFKQLRSRARRFIRTWRAAIVFAIAGMAAVCASVIPGPGIDSAWTRDLLMTIGASLALFAPLYFITRSLDTHLDEMASESRQQVEEVRQQSRQELENVREDVTAQFATLRVDVDRRLSEFGDRVSKRLQAEAAADSEAFEMLRTNAPTRASVVDALSRADDLGLTSLQHAPRVDVSDRIGLYVSARLDSDPWADVPLTLRLERTDGEILASIEWPESATAEDVFTDVGRAIRKHSGEAFEPARFLVGLADLLEAALTEPERRPAIELCGDQWMICDQMVVTSGRGDVAPIYGLTVDQIRPEAHVGFVTEKHWVDADSFESARAIALTLFPDRRAAWGAGPDNPI